MYIMFIYLCSCIPVSFIYKFQFQNPFPFPNFSNLLLFLSHLIIIIISHLKKIKIQSVITINHTDERMIISVFFFGLLYRPKKCSNFFLDSILIFEFQIDWQEEYMPHGSPASQISAEDPTPRYTHTQPILLNFSIFFILTKLKSVKQTERCTSTFYSPILNE